jgi:uncharacterized repeat protein (TIGR01451 family)
MKFIKIVSLLFFSIKLLAVEVVVQNDSLQNNSAGGIQAGFVTGEQAAVWLDSPCDGNIVGVQVLWKSLNGGAPVSIEDRIQISDAATFPIPGALLDEIIGPVMTDGVINEFRFKDENNVIPLIVPVTSGNTYVVGLKFDHAPPATGPSVVNDTDTCQANRNGIHAFLPPLTWFSSCTLGVSGDFVIRAVVDCAAAPSTVDLSIVKDSISPSYTPGEDLTYSIVVNNAGPSAVTSATVIDFFPSELSNVTWVCSGTNGAMCTNTNGSGNITESVNLPVNSSLTYDAIATTDINTTVMISNTAQIVVPNGLTDIELSNNSSTKIIPMTDDFIFINGFED